MCFILRWLFWKPQRDLTLEHLLYRARMERSYWTPFYRRLLTDELFVVCFSGPNIASIHRLSDGRIPVFTSIERAFERNILQPGVPIMKVRGKLLFEAAKGETFVINPYSELRKDLTPIEVDRMLSFFA